MKANDYINWDEYFMGVAILSAYRSKDPNTKVGACIVDNQHKILSLGYNGLPMGCSDDDFPWERNSDNLMETKYPYVVHAELNAILNANVSLEGATLYVALFPCNECAKAIIQSGIKRVVYDSDKYHDSMESQVSRRLFDSAHIRYEQYQNSGRSITIEL